MAKRIIWKVGDVVSIKLREDLYTLGQMLTSPVMRFYDISNSNGVWDSVDLNITPSLFRVFVGKAINKGLVVEKVQSRLVIPSDKPYEPHWIKPYTLTMDEDHYPGQQGDFPFMGGRVIDLGPDGGVSTTSAPVVKEDLSLPDDRELIETLELTNMWGSEDLGDRLRRYFDSGVNRDDLKFEVFPELWDDREHLCPLTRRLPAPLR